MTKKVAAIKEKPIANNQLLADKNYSTSVAKAINIPIEEFGCEN